MFVCVVFDIETYFVKNMESNVTQFDEIFMFYLTTIIMYIPLFAFATK